jgi:hypothetical protein
MVSLVGEISFGTIKNYNPEFYWYNVTKKEFLGKYIETIMTEGPYGSSCYHKFVHGTACVYSHCWGGEYDISSGSDIIKQVISDNKEEVEASENAARLAAEAQTLMAAALKKVEEAKAAAAALTS